MVGVDNMDVDVAGSELDVVDVDVVVGVVVDVDVVVVGQDGGNEH